MLAHMYSDAIQGRSCMAPRLPLRSHSHLNCESSWVRMCCSGWNGRWRYGLIVRPWCTAHKVQYDRRIPHRCWHVGTGAVATGMEDLRSGVAGPECASVLCGVAKPDWFQTTSWRGDAREVVWRADEMELVGSTVINSSGVNATDPELPDSWRASLKGTLLPRSPGTKPAVVYFNTPDRRQFAPRE